MILPQYMKVSDITPILLLQNGPLSARIRQFVTSETPVNIDFYIRMGDIDDFFPTFLLNIVISRAYFAMAYYITYVLKL